MTDAIVTGDTVRHRPTGETWFVLGVNEEKNDLVPAGWPHSLARLSDCELVVRGSGITDAERASRGKMFPGKKFDD